MMLQDVIRRFSTAAADGSPDGYMVTRTAAPTMGTNGVQTSGGTSTLLIDASVQPYRPRAIDVLPEGVRAEDVRVIDTTTRLQAQPADLITIAGDSYAVYSVDGPTYSPDGSTRYTALAARQVVPG